MNRIPDHPKPNGLTAGDTRIPHQAATDGASQVGPAITVTGGKDISQQLQRDQVQPSHSFKEPFL